MPTEIESRDVVSGRTGEIYTVKRYDDWTAKCTCQGWEMNQSKMPLRIRECKHIKELGWGKPQLDGYGLVAKIANIFAPTPYLFDIVTALLIEDDKVIENSKNRERSRLNPLAENDRRMLLSLLEWFNSSGFDLDGDARRKERGEPDPTHKAEEILTRAIQLRMAPAVGQDGKPLAEPAPSYDYIVKRMHRELTGAWDTPEEDDG